MPSPLPTPTRIKCDAQTVVFLCNRTGVAPGPWAAAGYACVQVDTDPRGWVNLPAGVTHVEADVRTLGSCLGRPFGVVAFPPCTDLASVGCNSWERKGVAKLADALAVADACLRFAVRSRAEWWCIENPSGRLSQHWGPPDHVFSHHEYGGYLEPSGDAWTKRTCLWVGGSFVMPRRKPVEPVEGSLVANTSSVDRRNQTPAGFARALFEANARERRDLVTLDGALFDVAEAACECCGRHLARNARGKRFCSTRCRVHSHRARKIHTP